MHKKVVVPTREGSLYGRLKPSSGGHDNVEQASSHGVFHQTGSGRDKQGEGGRWGEKGVNGCEELARVNDTQVTVRSRLT